MWVEILVTAKYYWKRFTYGELVTLKHTPAHYNDTFDHELHSRNANVGSLSEKWRKVCVLAEANTEGLTVCVRESLNVFVCACVVVCMFVLVSCVLGACYANYFIKERDKKWKKKQNKNNCSIYIEKAD